MNLSRLSGRKVCERVKTKGMLWKGKHFFSRILHGAPINAPQSSSGRIFVGLLTSTKLDKSAVKRNRMRRRCREALRIRLKENSTFYILHSTLSFQLLLLPRSSSLSAPFGELLSDAERLLSHLTAGVRRS